MRIVIVAAFVLSLVTVQPGLAFARSHNNPLAAQVQRRTNAKRKEMKKFAKNRAKLLKQMKNH
jgi:hypothetical protein